MTEEEFDEIGITFPTRPVKGGGTVESEGVDRDAGIEKSFDGGSAMHFGEFHEETVEFRRWRDCRRCGGMFRGASHAITEETVERG
jgi:hypothetical protein